MINVNACVIGWLCSGAFHGWVCYGEGCSTYRNPKKSQFFLVRKCVGVLRGNKKAIFVLILLLFSISFFLKMKN